MLFLLGGRRNPAVRAVLGALLVVIGIAIHGGAILAGIGVILLVWAALQALKAYRIGRQSSLHGGRMP